MPILIITLAIAALLLLIMWLRFNAFIALILVATGTALVSGLAPTDAIKAVQKGVGDTLGSLALILGLGAMLGSLIAESGAAKIISGRLIRAFGLSNLHWAMILTGFIVGVPMFFSVAFLVVIPIVYAVAKETKLPLLYVGIPMICALSVTHGFLPPHPAPTAIVEFYKADMQLTLLYGVAIAIPTIILSGAVYGRFFRHYETPFPDKLFTANELPAGRLPGFWISILTAIMPVLLMAIAATASLTMSKEASLYQALQFIGDPVMSLFISVLFAAWTLGVRTGAPLAKVMEKLGESVKPVAAIMLIVAGGGAFKEVLVQGGVSQYIVDNMKNVQLSPLVLAWCVAAVLRITLGSATVAALTAAGIVQPLVGAGVVNPELLVLATGAGSLTFGQVNDTGFWLFKEYFNLSITETLKSWTVMETLISIAGLAGCLLLNLIIDG
jgi:gluconate transporter